MSNLFVEESQFDSKGFEMIACIKTHFNPLGAVDFLGYIFDLNNIRQARDESIVTLKAQFLHVFCFSQNGGISIDSTLQV
jgi:hypothetical protein